MGAGVSSWVLANSVASYGQLGVVSGTALDMIFARRLQLGDPGGHMRRALKNFPVPEMAQRIMDRFFVEGGKKRDEPFKGHTMFSLKTPQSLLELTVVANFVEVFLAKEGHKGSVGINYLEKIQLPNLSSIYGAMLAGVDYVLMGAGIPREIPGIMEKLTGHGDVSMNVDVEGATSEDDFKNHFSPEKLMDKAIASLPKLRRPKFLAIIASTILAMTMVKKSTGKVDGFVIEGPTAGGHNAPPRGALKISDSGEPVYGKKDEVDLDKIRDLGLPFWLAGDYGSPEKLKEALAAGAAGVQVGTAFAFCEESGVEADTKQRLIDKALAGEAEVFTDPLASPTGFPFKVARLKGTNSESEVFDARPRICDIGFLRHIFKVDSGNVGYRCPSEPVKDYVRKGGAEEETVGRKCLCNGLMSNIGLEQVHKDGYRELPLVTVGDDFKNIPRVIKKGERTYTAAQVLDYLLDKEEMKKVEG